MSTTLRRKSSLSMNGNRKDATRERILQMEADREERRKALQQAKEARKLEHAANIAAGNPGDVDFIGLVREWRSKNAGHFKQHETTSHKICVCVRKRPISSKERDKLDHDSVTCVHPHHLWIHSAKLRVDGITKYLTHNSFKLDYAFDESVPTEQIYLRTCMPLVDFVLEGKGGRATVFCYGQTGSGKTYTMNGIQNILCHDLYSQLQQHEHGMESGEISVTVAFFELYGGFIQDLLNERNRCKLLEDGQGEVNILGLREMPANTPQELLDIVEMGNNLRTTHATEANDTSSRSHAICQVFIRDTSKRRPKLLGKLSLVDLAGSERGSDTKSHNSQRRTESADINTSLLSLKECIRALGQSQVKHVPYRGSKLTLILKDCFTSASAKTVMVATVSPGASSADHSLNTLRYADRIKEQKAKTSGSSSGNRSAHGRKVYPCSKERMHRILGSEDDSDDYHSAVDDEQAAAQEADEQNERNEIDTVDQWLQEGEEVEEVDPNHFADALQSPCSAVGQSDIPSVIVSGRDSGLSNDVADDDSLENGRVNHTDDASAFAALAPPAVSAPMGNGIPHLSDEDDTARDESQLQSRSAHQRQSTATSTTTTNLSRVESAKQDQDELRKTVQTLFELEESLLNQHMENIQENAEMLTQEGKLLQMVQNGTLDEEMDAYAVTLAEFLDRKTKLIHKLQGTLEEFKSQLVKEQELSQRVKSLSQY